MPEGKFRNVTLFIPTRREGLFVGRVEGEGMAELVQTLRKARDSGKDVTFFLWDRRGRFSLTVGVDERGGEAPQRRGAPGYRPIRRVEPEPEPDVEEQEFEEEEPEEEPAKPAKRRSTPSKPERGRTMKSVFDGLD